LVGKKQHEDGEWLHVHGPGFRPTHKLELSTSPLGEKSEKFFTGVDHHGAL
jgi:hypothetical protein